MTHGTYIKHIKALNFKSCRWRNCYSLLNSLKYRVTIYCILAKYNSTVNFQKPRSRILSHHVTERSKEQKLIQSNMWTLCFKHQVCLCPNFLNNYLVLFNTNYISLQEISFLTDVTPRNTK